METPNLDMYLNDPIMKAMTKAFQAGRIVRRCTEATCKNGKVEDGCFPEANYKCHKCSGKGWYYKEGLNEEI